jgi:hypothetical protein
VLGLLEIVAGQQAMASKFLILSITIVDYNSDNLSPLLILCPVSAISRTKETVLLGYLDTAQPAPLVWLFHQGLTKTFFALLPQPSIHSPIDWLIG